MVMRQSTPLLRLRALPLALGLFLAALLAPPLSGPLRADQTDPALNALFALLLEAPDPTVAAPIEREIWLRWTEQADPAVEALMETAGQAMAVDDYDEALAALDRVVDMAPDYAEGWNRRATVLYLIGRPRASLADIERVLALEPRHFGALSGQGLCLMAMDRPEEAAAAFAAALAIHPQMEGAQANLERLRRSLGDDI